MILDCNIYYIVLYIVFFTIFAVEMICMISGWGMKFYWTHSHTAFDGFIVIFSALELFFLEGAAATAFREGAALMPPKSIRALSLLELALGGEGAHPDRCCCTRKKLSSAVHPARAP